MKSNLSFYHHRHSIRLKGYDYSQAGSYFVTICVQKNTNTMLRPYMFGNVVNGEMVLNDAGRMVEKWCLELSNKFPDIFVDTYIVMPNHFHAIFVNTGTPIVPLVGADLRVCPLVEADTQVCPYGEWGEHNDNQWGEHNDNQWGEHNDNQWGEHNDNQWGEHNDNQWGEHIGSPLHAVVQWFKTMSTNEYIRGVKTLGWQPFNKKLWQRNYWEHIIRNKKEYQHVVNYIIKNPIEWEKNKFHQQ